MATGEDPHLSERERVIVRALHDAAATERAPVRLREQIEAGRARGRRPAGVIPALGAAAVTLAVIVAVSVLLIIPGGTPGAPSIASAATLATRGADLPAPATDPSAVYRLKAKVGSLHFPNWQENPGWRAVGSRTDRLGDRDVTTVYYRRDGTTIAYSIVSSPTLPATRWTTFTLHGRTVFTWWQRDHTCMLSGTGVDGATLQSLARASGAKLS